jgi:hypothetical protein
LSADNSSVVRALTGAGACLKLMFFHGKPRVFAQTKVEQFACLGQKVTSQPNRLP